MKCWPNGQLLMTAVTHILITKQPMGNTGGIFECGVVKVPTRTSKNVDATYFIKVFVYRTTIHPSIQVCRPTNWPPRSLLNRTTQWYRCHANAFAVVAVLLSDPRNKGILIFDFICLKRNKTSLFSVPGFVHLDHRRRRSVVATSLHRIVTFNYTAYLPDITTLPCWSG